MIYANRTNVSAERSKGEIERTLVRYGADQFMYGWRDNCALVGFRMNNRMIQFLLPMPDKRADEFFRTPAGRKRGEEYAAVAFELATRQKWRALALAIKAKLEAVQSGITTFEQEFLAHILMPNGQRFGDWATPQITMAYETKKMPQLLSFKKHPEEP